MKFALRKFGKTIGIMQVSQDCLAYANQVRPNMQIITDFEHMQIRSDCRLLSIIYKLGRANIYICQ